MKVPNRIYLILDEHGEVRTEDGGEDEYPFVFFTEEAADSWLDNYDEFVDCHKEAYALTKLEAKDV